MRLEILVPDGMTFAEFKNATPPDGIIIRAELPPEAQQYSLDVSVSISVVIDVAATVKSIAVATLIVSAFRHYLRKYPNASCTINRKQIALEHSEIVRLIDEVQADNRLQQPKDAKHQQ